MSPHDARRQTENLAPSQGCPGILFANYCRRRLTTANHCSSFPSHGRNAKTYRIVQAEETVTHAKTTKTADQRKSERDIRQPWRRSLQHGKRVNTLHLISFFTGDDASPRARGHASSPTQISTWWCYLLKAEKILASCISSSRPEGMLLAEHCFRIFPSKMTNYKIRSL